MNPPNDESIFFDNISHQTSDISHRLVSVADVTVVRVGRATASVTTAVAVARGAVGGGEDERDGGLVLETLLLAVDGLLDALHDVARIEHALGLQGAGATLGLRSLRILLQR